MTTLRSFLQGNLKKRNVILRLRQSAERRTRGRGLSSAWQIGKHLESTPQGARWGTRTETAASETATFFRVTAAKPATAKKARELEHASREPDFGSQRSRLLHGSSGNTISALLACDANHSKRWSRAPRRVTKTGEAKGKQASGTNTSRTQKQFPPLKRSKASWNASIFSAPIRSQDSNRREPKKPEHGCSWSGSGWHSSAARIVTFRRKLQARAASKTDSQESELAADLARRIFPSRRLARVKLERLVVARARDWQRQTGVRISHCCFTSKRLTKIGVRRDRKLSAHSAKHGDRRFGVMA